MKNLIIPFLFLFALVTSCKKEPEVVIEEKTPLELFTNNSSKSWRLKEGIAKQNGLEVNIIASQNPCITDNLIKLYSDFSYEFTEGVTKCDPNNPDLILKAEWSLGSEGKSITIDKFIFLSYSVDNPTFYLSEITETTFTGTTNLTIQEENVDLDVVFEAVP
ncbi:MAG: hypothetical protein ACI8UX_000898 [Psychromonas sp.]|jgi:hypothetical protein